MNVIIYSVIGEGVVEMGTVAFHRCGGVSKYLHAMYKDYNLLIKPVIQPLEKSAKEITELAQIYLGTMIHRGATSNVQNEKQPKCSTVEDSNRNCGAEK